jgi:hypothetical protein
MNSGHLVAAVLLSGDSFANKSTAMTPGFRAAGGGAIDHFVTLTTK